MTDAAIGMQVPHRGLRLGSPGIASSATLGFVVNGRAAEISPLPRAVAPPGQIRHPLSVEMDRGRIDV
jgi:hypothetical protein